MKFTKSKARALSNICTDIAQVFFALFVGTLVLPVDSSKIFVIVLELGFSIVFWILAILFAEKGKI